MSRRLAVALIGGMVGFGGVAHGEEAVLDADGPGDQGIGADVGLVIGGRSTPGGLRFAGHYLYRLSDEDWFDGTASFTFGSGSPDCFTDRRGGYVCEHGYLGGRAVEVTAAVRRMLATDGSFRPFARVGIGIAIVRFSDDDVTGFTIPLHAGGGVRVQVIPEVAVVAQAELVLGVGAFGHSLGIEPQLGAGVLVGAEFRLP